MFRLNFSHNDKLPLYIQIANSVIHDIDRGQLKKNFQLPSINEVNKEYSIARDTVEKAYNELKRQGYLTSSLGRGHFITGKKEGRLKILLVFNKLSSFKRIVYDSIVHALGTEVKIDLQIHHYDPDLLNEIIENSLGHYHYYVIMPHFNSKRPKKQVLDILNKIPASELLLLDKNIPELGEGHMSVFQDFENDIYVSLSAANDLLSKYRNIKMVFEPMSNHPLEILEGAKKFCKENKKKLEIINDINQIALTSSTAYIITGESDLAFLIKKVRSSTMTLGKDIGIISFNEAPLKELLDITVITTDFEAMGKTAAQLILKRKYKQLQNPFKLIRRKSL